MFKTIFYYGILNLLQKYALNHIKKICKHTSNFEGLIKVGRPSYYNQDFVNNNTL